MQQTNIVEKELHPMSGLLALLLCVLGLAASTAAIVFGSIQSAAGAVALGVTLIVLGAVGWVVFPVLTAGLKVVHPNEARVLTLFGNYHGTIKAPGFYFVNPFCTSFSPAYNAAKTAAAAQAKEAEKQGRLAVVPVNMSKNISLKVRR